MAYAQVEPFGQDWLQSGMIAAMIANTARDPKRRREPFRPEEFMPNYEPPEPRPWQELLAKVQSINTAMGGKDLRQR